MTDLTAQRARLAEIERELARLRGEHDLAMSAFRFDKANLLQRQIVVLEAERQALAVALPAPAPVSEPTAGVVPVLARPRRRR